jgi:hypothetical protein
LSIERFIVHLLSNLASAIHPNAGASSASRVAALGSDPGKNVGFEGGSNPHMTFSTENLNGFATVESFLNFDFTQSSLTVIPHVPPGSGKPSANLHAN